MKLRLIRPQTAAQKQAWLDLRWQVLRAPWCAPTQRQSDEAGLQIAEPLLALDADDIAVGCGQMQYPERGVARIRDMAVAPDHLGRGVGQQLLARLETLARGRGCERIIAMARDAALGFYQQAGYQVDEPGPRLFEQIPHHWISKPIAAEDFSAFGLRLAAARDSDSEALQHFIFGVLGEYALAPEHDGIDQDLIAPARSYRDGLFELLRDAQGQLVATLALLPRSTELVELRRMYLAPQWRGRGLGRACLGHALRSARQRGFRNICLETAQVLEQARALYQWAGFRPTTGPRHARRCDLYMELAEF